MTTYTYRVGNVNYAMVATSQAKAKAYLKTSVGYSANIKYVGKNLPVITGFEAVGVMVPKDYITPKQHRLKLIKKDYRDGIITESEYHRELEIVKGWKS